MTDWEALANGAIERGALQKTAELAPLLEVVAADPPRTIVEIGSCKGGTLWAFSQVAAPDALLVSVDLPGGSSSGGTATATATLAALLRPTQRGEFIRGDSHSRDVLEAVSHTVNEPVDVLMIDGDHTYAGVKQDFEGYAPLVRDGGLVIFHDILPHPRFPAVEVHRLWSELRSSYESMEYCQPDHDAGWGQWGGIGVLKWRPDSRRITAR